MTLVVAGSNIMDLWATPERQKPEAFQSLEEFIKKGGHFLVFNAFNGRSMKHLKQFGVQTGVQHATLYRPNFFI